MTDKISTISYIGYKKDENNSETWFLVTTSKKNDRLNIPFPSVDMAIEAWKSHIEDNLIDKKSSANQTFTTLVKNIEGDWSYQLIYKYDAKSKKTSIVREDIESKKDTELKESKKVLVKKEAHESVMPEYKKEGKPLEQKVTKLEGIKEEEIKNNEENNKYIGVRRAWLYTFVVLLFASFALSIWAFVYWIQQ